jgi:hypothetical protein
MNPYFWNSFFTTWRGRPTMDGKTARGASSPANPALHIPEPLSTTRAATSSSHIFALGVWKSKNQQYKRQRIATSMVDNKIDRSKFCLSLYRSIDGALHGDERGPPTWLVSACNWLDKKYWYREYLGEKYKMLLRPATATWQHSLLANCQLKKSFWLPIKSVKILYSMQLYMVSAESKPDILLTGTM